MYLQKKFRFGLLVVLAGLIAGALPLSAQQLYRGTFELPVVTHWNGAVLEPGEYTVTVEQGLSLRLIRIQGEGRTAVAVAGTFNIEPFAENGRLTFENVGGAYVIREFDAGPLGQSFKFDVPKALQRQSASGDARTRDSVVLSKR
jgi:hypothetical protein